MEIYAFKISVSVKQRVLRSHNNVQQNCRIEIFIIWTDGDNDDRQFDGWGLNDGWDLNDGWGLDDDTDWEHDDDWDNSKNWIFQ